MDGQTQGEREGLADEWIIEPEYGVFGSLMGELVDRQTDR